MAHIPVGFPPSYLVLEYPSGKVLREVFPPEPEPAVLDDTTVVPLGNQRTEFVTEDGRTIVLEWKIDGDYFRKKLFYQDIDEWPRSPKAVVYSFSRATESTLNHPDYLKWTPEQFHAHFREEYRNDPCFRVFKVEITYPKPKVEAPEGILISEAIAIPTSLRPQHVYLLGRPGSGKSTLIRSMVLQDLESGRGVGVIDPHGDLVQSLLEMIPEDRQDDVILFSPETLIPLAVFRATSEVEKDLLADDIITLFRRLSDTWGPRMDAILRYSVRTLLEVPDSTFLDLHRILVDQSYRAQVVNKANIPAIGQYWSHVYPTYPKDSAHPILSRMGQFVVSSSLSEILGRPSKLDFFDLMQSGKVFLADLSQGKFGRDSSTLLGSLLVSQFQLAAMRRAHIPAGERKPYYLYVDEFQNFKSSAFPVILSEARKYNLALTIAHQYIYQLDDETRRAVLGTVGTRLFFALGVEDAKYIQPYIGNYEATDLLNFDAGDAIYSPPRVSDSRRLRTLIYQPTKTPALAGDIILNTLRTYKTEKPQEEPLDDEPGFSGPPDLSP